tara:strand:+ start:70 stop:408 length:339 start_codon:yes stop_codon:yes gene_type:complete
MKIVLDFQKAWAWSKAHWKWLVLVIGGIVLYALGRKSAKNLLIAAEAARDQYQKDKEAIEASAVQKSKANKKAVEQYHKTAELLKEKRDKEVSDIEDSTTEDILDDLGVKKL